MKKISVLLIVVIVIFSSVAYAEKWQGDYYNEDEGYYYDIMYCIVNPKTNGGLNVRYKPSRNSGVCYSLGFGDEVIVLDVKKGWAFCIVSWEGDKGWVSTKYLSYYEPVLTDVDMKVVSDSKVIIRDGPTKSSKKYKYIKNGDVVHIVYEIGDWGITKNWKFINLEYLVEENI